MLRPLIASATLGCSSLLLAADGAHRPGDLDVEERLLETATGATLAADDGRFWVPENRARADSRAIALVFVRLRSTAKEPGAPLVYLAGGPGYGATSMADRPGALASLAPLLAVGDVILLDQRGTGRSEPDLVIANDRPMHDVAFRDHDAARAAVQALSAEAAATLRARGVDLDGYTTVQSAHDVDELRRALGYERLNLFGFSYGTHLAQAIMKLHGAHVEHAVLCGVEGLDETIKLPEYADVQFARLARLVAADPTIGPGMPDLEGVLDRVLASLAEEPARVPVTDPRTGERVEVTVGPFGLLLILRLDLGDASDLVVFPRLIHSLDQGDHEVLAWFVQKRLGMLQKLSAMTFVTDLASGASPERMALVEAQSQRSRFGSVVNFPFLDTREQWQPPDLGAEFRAPLISDVRTLLLSGTLDWNTPPFQAERLRFGLTDAAHLIVEGAGHEQIIAEPAVRQAIVAFLAGDAVEQTVVRAPPLRFVPLEGFDPAATHPAVRPRTSAAHSP